MVHNKEPNYYYEKKASITLICVLILSACNLFAHPHVFIDANITFVFTRNGLQGIKAQWIFDEMFSNMVIHDYDKDKNREYSNKELRKLKKEMFSNLKDYDYFSSITIDGREYKVENIEDFSASIAQDRVIYTFFIPCEVMGSLKKTTITVSMFDRTYYVDIRLSKDNPVQFENDSLFDYDCRIFDNTEKAFYYGQAVPQEVIFTFNEKDE